MDRFDDQIEQLVSTAAAAAPAKIHDIDRVRHRGVALRRRRTMIAAGAATLLVAAMIPVWLTIQRGPSTMEPPISTPSQTASPWPGVSSQRLVGVIAWPAFPGTKVYAEVFPDSRIHEIDAPADLTRDAVVPGPDGGIATLAHQFERDGPGGPDCAPGVKRYLILKDRDLRDTLRRDIHRHCQSLRLIGVDQTNAYLLRNQSVVAHNLADESERVLFETTKIVWLGFNGSVIVAIEPNGIASGDSQPCEPMGSTIRTFDVVSSLTKSQTEGSVNPCTWIESPMASPDASHVAFLDADSSGSVDLKIIHLGTGEIVATKRIADGHDIIVAGAVWADSNTVWAVTFDQARVPTSTLTTVLT